MDLAQQLDRLLGNFSQLSPRIKHLTYQTDVCGERIDVRCSYIAFRDGLPTFDEFIDVAADLIIPFCLPRREIREAREQIVKSKARPCDGRPHHDKAERQGASPLHKSKAR